ncbi:MAG TPA: ParB/RepB/Spo0J family partition protein [Acidimicrobiales bacterium]|nr:ParB/RepB/Spo0J family partition protein [Acidimicrobiales bacterium]
MARRSALGKGLGALIPSESASDRGSALLEISLSEIHPNPLQPRENFDEESLASLTASVREVGVLQPILVRRDGDGYELVAGERRWRAAKRAGLVTIPALVRTADDVASMTQALVENLHREDLNPMEEAAAYQQLIEDFGLTHEEVAARVGRTRASVSNTLRLFQLPPGLQRLVIDGQLSAGHARALLGTPDRAFQEQLARRAVAEGLSVRAVEEAIRHRAAEPSAATTDGPSDAVDSPTRTNPTTPPAPPRLRPPGLLELEELLSGHLDTRVSIEMGSKKGKMTVEFATLEDLERIYRVMVGEPSTTG